MTNQRELNNDEITIARTVHFVIEQHGRLRCRPAVVVEDWPESGRPGYVNIQVFTDNTNDMPYGAANGYSGIQWETSVLPNHAFRAHRSWHWPRECQEMQNPMEPPVDDDDKIRWHHNHGSGMRDPHNCHACRLLETMSKE